MTDTKPPPPYPALAASLGLLHAVACPVQRFRTVKIDKKTVKLQIVSERASLGSWYGGVG